MFAPVEEPFDITPEELEKMAVALVISTGKPAKAKDLDDLREWIIQVRINISLVDIMFSGKSLVRMFDGKPKFRQASENEVKAFHKLLEKTN
jgi:hypothetical protein